MSVQNVAGCHATGIVDWVVLCGVIGREPEIDCVVDACSEAIVPICGI